MSKKITSFIILFVFICFTFSCTSLKQINLVKGESLDRNGRIITVFTKSGDLVEFSDQKPATMVLDKIVGTVFDKTGVPKTVAIPLTEVEVVWVKIESVKPLLLLPLAAFGVWCSYGFISYISNPD